MAEHQTKGKTFNTWVQTIFIIVAGLWGIYTFIYREITVPSSAPLHITLDLQLTEVGTRDSGADIEAPLSAIEIKVSATNPSSRTIYLLSSAFQATGIKIGASHGDKTFVQEVNKAFEAGRQGYVSRESQAESATPVAVGGIFNDTSLGPKETISTTIVLWIPKNKYDVIAVTAQLPTSGKADAVESKLLYDDKEQLNIKLFRIGSDGRRLPMPLDQSGAYSDRELELQTAQSYAELSLWQNAKPSRN